MTHFGFVLSWLGLESSLLSFISPLGWVLCLMKFTGVSSLASLMKFSAARTSFAFDFYIFNQTSSNLHTTMWGITLSLGQRVLQGIQCPLNQTRGAIEHTIMCLTIYLFTCNPFHHNVAMHVLFRCNVTMHVILGAWFDQCWSVGLVQTIKFLKMFYQHGPGIEPYVKNFISAWCWWCVLLKTGYLCL